jgi:hypothetical protein
MSAAILIFLSLLFSTSAPAKPAPPAKAAAASKVWTNEDVQALESTGSISIVGQAETAQPAETAAASSGTQSVAAPRTQGLANPAAQPVSAATPPYVKEQDPDWYAQGIESRREQIDQIDDQVQEIQHTRATGEGISDAIPLDKTAPGITPEATIEILQDQKSRLEADIDGLQDLAQSNSIERDSWR